MATVLFGIVADSIRVDCLHVVPVLDVGEEREACDEPLMYLVMPLIVGATLRTTLLDGPIPLLRASRLAGQLLAGLAALHRLGAIHRDVKPESCLMAQVYGREHLRLADFGLAQAMTVGLIANPLANPPTSSSGALVGTAAYTSPEQVLGSALDERSDVYAAGVVLYELLVRRTPFRGAHFDLLNAHVHAAPPLPSSVAPQAASCYHALTRRLAALMVG